MFMSAVANSAGVAQDFIGPVSQGFVWYVERMTTWSNTAQAAPLLEIFVLTTDTLPSSYTATVGDRVGRQDLTLTAKNDVADENSAIYVPEGYHLVGLWTGLTSGDAVQLSTQITVHRMSLDIEDRRQVLQQTEPTPDINAEEVRESDGLLAHAERATADFFKSVEKAL